MLNPFKKFYNNLRAMVINELEVIKLKAYKGLTAAVANAYMAISLLIFFNTTLILCGIWLGFYMSHLLDSFHAGFGVTAALFLVLLILMAVFRNALMIRPVQNLMIKMYDQHEEAKEAKKEEEAAQEEREKAEKEKARQAEVRQRVHNKNNKTADEERGRPE